MATVVGKTRRNASVESIFTCVAPASALYDTRRGSPNGRYVNRVMDALLKATQEIVSGVAESYYD